MHGRIEAMAIYRERLWPAPWVPVVAALAVPASLLTFAAIDLVVGAITGLVLAGGVIGIAVLTAPIVEVSDGMLRAGSARIALSFVSEVETARGSDARHARGPALDARAHLVLRPDIDPVVRVTITDPQDPVPYWLISTRRPDVLAAAITHGAQ